MIRGASGRLSVRIDRTRGQYKVDLFDLSEEQIAAVERP